ncbi:MAG: hypothetical protein QXG86_00295 [Candidatus Woesearchaeota archaeon]
MKLVKNKIIKNKKGIATSLIIDVWAVIAYFLVFLVIYIALTVSTRIDYAMYYELLKEEKTMELLNILKTPVDEQKTIADYLIDYDLKRNKEVKDKIIETLEKNKIYSSISCISFNFEEKNEIIVISPLTNNCDSLSSHIKVTEIRFPTPRRKVITASSYAFDKQ